MSQPDGPIPAHPGRILLERVMEPLGISRNQLARDIDVPVGRVSDLTNGKRGITADTALRLARYFGMPAQLWLRLQAEFDLHVMRVTAGHEIEARVRVFEGAKAAAPPAEAADPPAVAARTAEPAAAVVVEPVPAEEPDRPAGPERAALEAPCELAVMETGPVRSFDIRTAVMAVSPADISPRAAVGNDRPDFDIYDMAAAPDTSVETAPVISEHDAAPADAEAELPSIPAPPRFRWWGFR